MNNWSSVYHIPPRPNQIRYMTLPQYENGQSDPAPLDPGPRKRADAALQSHAAFFDTDGDGVIWPSDTFAGVRALGLGVLLSFLAMLLIHGAFSWVTSDSFLPDPFFRLKVENMHKAKHGSDTEAYTSTGAFDEDRFNYIFDMYSTKPHTHMTFKEGVCMVRGNRDAFDPFGWAAAALEWLLTYLVLSPEEDGMKKEDVRALYDGSVFYKISGRLQESDKKL